MINADDSLLDSSPDDALESFSRSWLPTTRKFPGPKSTASISDSLFVSESLSARRPSFSSLNSIAFDKRFDKQLPYSTSTGTLGESFITSLAGRLAQLAT